MQAQFATPLPGPRPASVVIHDHFRSDYARYHDSLDVAFGDSVLAKFCEGQEDVCEKAASNSVPKYRGGQWQYPGGSATASTAQVLDIASFKRFLSQAGNPVPKYASESEFCSRADELERTEALAGIAGDDAAKEIANEVCLKALDDDGVIAKGKSWKPRAESISRLPLRLPATHRRGEIVRYLRDENKSTLGLLTQFATGVSDKEAYAVTDVLSGLMGRVLFAASFAAVVATDTAGDQVTRRFVEHNRANILRMINNGGTLSARLLFPVHAHSGPTFQSASSVYGTFGLVGPVGASDSLRFASTVVAEMMTSLAIRDVLESATDLGELLIGGRIGYGFSESELLAGTNDKSFPYAQLGIGIRKNGALALSALVTWPMERKYKDFAPRKLLLNFSASP
jgi:hypothetical protein